MAKLKSPLFSLNAVKSLGQIITFRKSRARKIAEAKPEPFDPKSASQLSWRHLFLKVVALWNALTPAEQFAWETNARPYHLTGYQRFVSQALRPNPGIYLPLQGGNMTGSIDMSSNDITGLEDPDAPQDADTQAARDAAIAAALADPFDVHLFAQDGGTWHGLKVQSAAQHNLRVALYSGASPIAVTPFSTSLPAGTIALAVNANLKALNLDSGFYTTPYIQTNTDAMPNHPMLMGQSALLGYNSATWDRLRTWLTGILKVGRSDIGLSDARLTAQGQVKAAPGNLYWMLLNPSAGNSLVELTDSLAAGAPVKIDHFDTARDGHMINFDPPAEFSTGIFLQTLTNITSIIFGYV